MKKILWTILILSVAMSPQFGVLSAQSTPDSSTPESAEDGSLDVLFGLAPVGDYPEGYFSDTLIEPGSSAVFEMQVVNVGVVAVDLILYPTNAHNGENGGFVAGNSDEELEGSAAWVDLDPQPVSVQPNTAADISFTVTVPEGTPPGQYISALVVETAEPIDVPGSDLFRQTIRQAISLSIVVPGEEVFEFEIGSPQAVENYWQIPIANTGNFLVKPEGTLEVVDGEGNIVATQPVKMGSIYGGNESFISLFLPEQLPAGEYALQLELSDAESGASATLQDETISIEEEGDATGLQLAEATVTPNDEDISFATVSLNLNNGGEDLLSTNVTLQVMLDGELIEEYPLATDQTLRGGETTIESRYIPADLWQSGTYSFSVTVTSGGDSGDQEILLLEENLDTEIVVP